MTPLLGCVPDRPDARDHLFARTVVGATPPLTPSDDVDLRRFLPEAVRTQRAQDCCAHAAMTSAYGVACASGTPIAFPSVLFPFAVTRLVDLPKDTQGHATLVDTGTSLRTMFKALATRIGEDEIAIEGYGLVREERWPETVENVNVVPPEDCFRAGENATIESYSRIPEGDGAPDGLVAALRRLRFPTLCMDADQKLVEIGEGVYDAPGGKVLGGHAQLVCGFSRALDAFLIRGSWGKDFGNGGYVWLARAFVARFAFDMWVVEVSPERVA